jgi:hypothetical protein
MAVKTSNLTQYELIAVVQGGAQSLALVITGMNMSTIFWDLKVDRLFRGTYRLHPLGLGHAGILPGLFVNPEDGGDMFLKTSVEVERTTRRCILVTTTVRTSNPTQRWKFPVPRQPSCSPLLKSCSPCELLMAELLQAAST